MNGCYLYMQMRDKGRSGQIVEVSPSICCIIRSVYESHLETDGFFVRKRD